jgi:hypothetical protein
VHLLTPPAEFGDTKCCTNVVAWAEDAEDFTATVSAFFAKFENEYSKVLL